MELSEFHFLESLSALPCFHRITASLTAGQRCNRQEGCAVSRRFVCGFTGATVVKITAIRCRRRSGSSGGPQSPPIHLNSPSAGTLHEEQSIVGKSRRSQGAETRGAARSQTWVQTIGLPARRDVKRGRRPSGRTESCRGDKKRMK